MKQIIAALLAIVLLLPGMASANPNAAKDSWVVHRHKDWVVEYVLYNDNTAQCLAAFKGRLSSFIIFSDGNGAMMKFYDGGNAGPDRYVEFNVKIDQRRAWRIDGEIEGGALWGELYDERLLMEIAQGRALRLYFGRDLIYTYSLSGSMAAMVALADCVDKL